MFSRRSILQAIAALPFGSLLTDATEEPDRLAALGELYESLEFDGQGPRYYFIAPEYAKPHLGLEHFTNFVETTGPTFLTGAPILDELLKP